MQANNQPLIACLAGDGIGPEVQAEALKVLARVSERFALPFTFVDALVGGAAYDATGHPLPPATTELCDRADAILFGAVGGPKYDNLPFDLRPEAALLAIRKRYDFYANLRPTLLFAALADASPLKNEIVGQGVDIMILRELTGGIYFGEPRGIEELPDGTQRGFNTEVYCTAEVQRIARLAFELAMGRRKKVTSVDKANVLESSRLWRQVVEQVAKDFPDVALEHVLVDAATMHLLRRPQEFDVMLCNNMFGDIISDEAAMITGSIGLLPSASLGQGSKGFYEPVHGSAPDIAGQGKANPLASILCAAMMLRHSFGHADAAAAMENAVAAVLAEGYRTPDIHSPGTELVGTVAMGDLVADRI